MEKSLEKIRNELEQKRKHNMELVQNLKQKSILYKVEKERQKNYFLNKTSSFLNKKRKPSNPIINEDNTQQELSSYELMNLNNDYDDYYDDFVNNSMISNKSFNNLNFTRIERFSFQKIIKKLKYTKKKEQGFSIMQGNQTTNYQIENNISFQSSVQQKINNNEELGFNIFSSNKIPETKENNISFFDNINKKDDDTKENVNNSQNIKGSLFGSNMPNINEKTLFSSNIPLNDKNNKENKKELNETNNDEKKSTNLFGNIERLKSEENKETTLFGSPTKPNQEKEKEKEIEKTPETPKKEIINNNNLSREPSTPKIETKDIEEKEKNEEKEGEAIKLFDEKQTPLFDKKEKKEKITLPPLNIIKEEEEPNNEKKENNENNNKSLFGNTPITVTEKGKNNDKDNNKSSLFSGTGLFKNEKVINNNISLFGNNNEEKNDNKPKVNLFGIEEKPNQEIKEENKEKEKLNINLFNNNNTSENNNIPSLFGNNDQDNKIKTNEEPKSNISSKAAGSLATNSNPFLNPNTPNNVPNVFNAGPLLNSNKKENNNQNEPLFKVGISTSLFNNNTNPTFGNQGMGLNNGGMDMSPRNLFNNNFQNNNNSLFGNSNNLNTNNINIFGAPNNNNNNSFFNNNGFQQQNSGLFGQGSLFSGNNSNSSFSGFSLGKKS